MKLELLAGNITSLAPSTRYQGSKRKILLWLYENLKDLKFEINQREIKAKEEYKTGLILLAGNQCSLGITLPLFSRF